MQNSCNRAPLISYTAWSHAIIEACRQHNTTTVVTAYAPIGPTATAIKKHIPIWQPRYRAYPSTPLF